MDEQQIDAEVARQLKALVAKIAAEKLAAALDADPELKRAIEERAELTAQSQLARLAAEAVAQVAPPPFDHLGDWVENYLAYVYWRDVDAIGESGWRWCPEWAEHPEAVERLGPLYQRWQEQSVTPEGMLAWWDVADRMMGKLMAPNGPYKRCTKAKHYDGEDAGKLTCAPPPQRLLQVWTAA
ncbi:DUF4913 domain-containing protein [Nocardia yamanashiensis]|uniref:DUF4913 domain-containing protein n=1 Tax=Nocardia yamanashiensis TaxID=209247 RepID=UPI000830E21B|nr:DUF4913 domain-containing protein [Nocardia yamanashiensis]